jgi:hypothetical protein
MKRDWHELISQPKYKVKVEKDIYVTMRDGVRLAVDVHRPDADGKFPALLALSPYGKELQELEFPLQPLGKSAVWDGVMEAGDSEYFVSRGYAHIIGDLRGTGYSEGEYVGLHSKKEGEDGYDIVEWIAEQPWCDGNVGMVGYSYFGEIQLDVAITEPPHLKAIFPTGVWTDLYRMAYQGGILSLFLYGLWDGRAGNSGFAGKNVHSAMMRMLSKDEFESRVEEALKNPDIRKFPNLYHLLKYPYKNPLFVDLLLNPYNGPFYWERSAYYDLDKIKIPTYVVGAMAHRSATKAHFELYNKISSPNKKVAMYPPGMPDRPWIEGIDTVLRWYDHWLKGIDTGIMDELPVKFFIMGVNEWRYETEWPLTRAIPTKFYLRSWEGLSQEPEAYSDEPDCFVQQPLYASSKIESVKYVSTPMSKDTEAIGPVALYFYASIDTDDTNWIVELRDVSRDGSEQLLGKGYLRASQRALDESKSKPLQPYHPHTSSQAVVPNEIYEYAIEVAPIANVFKAGHRIKLTIRSMESPTEPEMLTHFHPTLPSSRRTLHKIYRDKEHKSYLLLPIIPQNGR